mgnify:CR=1 FL=1
MNSKSQPLEIERKFLIEYPDTALLDRLSGGNRSEISQTYLVGKKGTSERVRARTRDGVTVYTHNVKVKLSSMMRVENEDEISEEEYNEFLKRADKSRRTIEKIRYCIPHGEFVCEIDLFPFWSDKAFLEIEMPSEDTEITLPDFVKLIREVTDDNRYTNNALAKEIPE